SGLRARGESARRTARSRPFGVLHCGSEPCRREPAPDLSTFAPTLDPWILLLRVSTLTVFAGATLIALWNARLAWAEQCRWGSKLWSVLLAFASGTLLRVAFVSNLVGFDVNY